MKHCCALIGIALAMAGAPVVAGAQDATTPVTAAAPSLDIGTLDGGHFSLAAQRGKWVVINYWATWCGPCVKEMPALSALAARRDQVRVIGLDYEDTPRDDIEAFLAKHPVTYPVARVDPADPPPGLAPPDVLPTTFVVAPDGELARTWVGPLDMHKLQALIDSGKDAP